MTVFEPTRSLLTTNPDGRNGRKPTTVRMIRSQEAWTRASFRPAGSPETRIGAGFRVAHASAELSGYQALVLDQAFARRIAERALPLNEQVDRGGLHRLLASIAAHPADPQLRDLKRAREHADGALAIDSGIANTLAFVEHYAIPAQDRAAITDKLQQLTEQKVTTPEDALARARAELLTARIEDRLE